jgi:hypothetical protein
LAVNMGNESKLPLEARVAGYKSEGRRSQAKGLSGSRKSLLLAFAVTAASSMEAWLAAEETAQKMAKQHAWLEGYQLRAAKRSPEGKQGFEVWGAFDLQEALRRAQQSRSAPSTVVGQERTNE